jgi:hypothetical protein
MVGGHFGGFWFVSSSKFAGAPFFASAFANEFLFGPFAQSGVQTTTPKQPSKIAELEPADLRQNRYGKCPKNTAGNPFQWKGLNTQRIKSGSGLAGH